MFPVHSSDWLFWVLNSYWTQPSYISSWTVVVRFRRVCCEKPTKSTWCPKTGGGWSHFLQRKWLRPEKGIYRTLCFRRCAGKIHCFSTGFPWDLDSETLPLEKCTCWHRRSLLHFWLFCTFVHDFLGPHSWRSISMLCFVHFDRRPFFLSPCKEGSALLDPESLPWRGTCMVVFTVLWQ